MPPVVRLSDLDADAFDSAVEARAEGDVLLSRLLDEAGSPEARALTSRGLLDVQAALRAGRPGFWHATAWLRARLPSIRVAPAPNHERWDALVEIHKAHPESAWLVAQLVAALDEEQRRLASRAVLGVERRFGQRGLRILRRTLRGAPLEAHVLSRLG